MAENHNYQKPRRYKTKHGEVIPSPHAGYGGVVYQEEWAGNPIVILLFATGLMAVFTGIPGYFAHDWRLFFLFVPLTFITGAAILAHACWWKGRKEKKV